MKRLILVILLVLVAFYGVWPGLSAYSIYNSLDTEDPDTLETKVDWPTVRASFKKAIEPTVTSEMERELRDRDVEASGGLVSSLSPQIVDLIVDTYMTPEGLIKLVKSGGKVDLEQHLLKFGALLPNALPTENREPQQDGLKNVLNGIGGILNDIPGTEKAQEVLKKFAGGEAIEPLVEEGQRTDHTSSNTKANIGAFSTANIKSFSLVSPTEMEFAVAKDATSTVHDVTLAMGFKDMDWKLVKVIPNTEKLIAN